MAKPPALPAPEESAVGLDALLATKLHIPRTRHGLVPRPRLAGRLTGALEAELTVVCAPAGFGKTALLADWARRSALPVAWLSLDTADSDPARFWRHVAAALGGVREGVGQRLAPLLGPPSPRSFEAVVTTLVNELATSPGELVLVLDDYHLIDSRAVHQSLVFLIEHLPAGLRVVVASRADPPLPLARLRARGQLAELRGAELRFTLEEATALLREAVGPGLSADAVAALVARSEGWAAGLQLAALSLRGRADVAGFVKAFSGSHRHVLDYLAEEVLDRQPQQVRTFLLETAVLDRLCGPLCDAVTGRTGGQWLLEAIERANLFLTPWTRCGAGGVTTSCSLTCCVCALFRSGRNGCRRCTAPQLAGVINMGWPTTPSVTRWPSGTPRGRPGWSSDTSAACRPEGKPRPSPGG